MQPDGVVSVPLPQQQYNEGYSWRPGDPVEPLRVAWEALLEDAARCLEEAAQPAMLHRVSELMASCVDAGISVKYGRKVWMGCGSDRTFRVCGHTMRSCLWSTLDPGP